MNPCENSDEELTGDLPPEYLQPRKVAVVRPLANLAPISKGSLEVFEADEEPTVVEYRHEPLKKLESNSSTPTPKFFWDFFLEWRRQTKLNQEFESIHYSNTCYQKIRRVINRCAARIRANYRQTWNQEPFGPSTLMELIKEWRLQRRLSEDYERIHHAHTVRQKLRRSYGRFVERAKAHQIPNWEFPVEQPFTLKGLIKEWRRQNHLTKEFERIHYADTIYQKTRRQFHHFFARIKANISNTGY